MRELIHIEPVFKQMIWGGNRLRTSFGYDIPGEDTGECWAISAHPKGDCRIVGGTFAGNTLSDLWANHRELFGYAKQSVFPLLVKIIDAKADLSIQVHPDDAYAKVNENGSLGKTECWYILDCDADATIVIGHHAKTKQELADLIANGRWKELIGEIPIHPGDFFQIEPGTVHAIKRGTLLLETQQNSDVTYRLYDYDRLQNGKPRELHIQKSIDVITCPQQSEPPKQECIPYEGGMVQTLVTCPYYRVRRVVVTGCLSMQQTEAFTLISVIDGAGQLNGIALHKGEHLLLPNGYGTYLLEGNMQLIMSDCGTEDTEECHE